MGFVIKWVHIFSINIYKFHFLNGWFSIYFVIEYKKKKEECPVKCCSTKSLTLIFLTKTRYAIIIATKMDILKNGKQRAKRKKNNHRKKIIKR